jgi:hypothetical protein
MEIPKRRSWESSKTVLSSQPEEDERDENTKANECSLSGQSNSCLDHPTPAVVEPQVAAHRGQEKVKEGSRLVRKLKQFRKGKHFVLVFTVCIQTLYRAFSCKCADCDSVAIDYSVTIEGTAQGFAVRWMLTHFI